MCVRARVQTQLTLHLRHRVDYLPSVQLWIAAYVWFLPHAESFLGIAPRETDVVLPEVAELEQCAE